MCASIQCSHLMNEKGPNGFKKRNSIIKCLKKFYKNPKTNFLINEE